MRILIIHNFYQNPGGEDVVFNQELNLLRENGHEVESLTFSNDSINSFWKSIIYFFRSIYNPASARILRKRIRVFNPHLIHVHNTFLVASPSIYKAAARMGVPVVQTMHNYRMICPSVYLYSRGKIYTDSIKKTLPLKAIFMGVYRNSIPHTFLVVLISAVHKILGTYKRNINQFIALNNYSRDLFLKSSLKLSDSQITVKPNFLIDPGFKSVAKEDYFIYVGRLSPEKGIATLLKAFKDIDDKLLIIGDGELKSMVESFSKENENIHYLGFKKREDIMDHIRKAKALVFSSEWYETFGLTIIEAFACSTAVIISDIGGHSQMVDEGKNGVHFTSGDPKDLIRAVQKFNGLSDKELMAKNARKEYETKYTAQVNYKFLIDIYKGLFNRRP